MAETPNLKIKFDPESIARFQADLAETLRPIRLIAIGAEGVEEVKRARAKHGSNADLAYGVGEASDSIARHLGVSTQDGYWTNGQIEKYIKALNDYGMAHGRTHTRAGVLLEEVIEAIAAKSTADLRTELVQVIAMAMDWVADIDTESTADALDEEA